MAVGDFSAFAFTNVETSAPVMPVFFRGRLQRHQILVASVVGVLSGVYVWKAPLEQYKREEPEKKSDDIRDIDAADSTHEIDVKPKRN